MHGRRSYLSVLRSVNGPVVRRGQFPFRTEHHHRNCHSLLPLPHALASIAKSLLRSGFCRSSASSGSSQQPPQPASDLTRRASTSRRPSIDPRSALLRLSECCTAWHVCRVRDASSPHLSWCCRIGTSGRGFAVNRRIHRRWCGQRSTGRSRHTKGNDCRGAGIR